MARVPGPDGLSTYPDFLAPTSRCWSYLTDVDETAHQILVTQCRDSVLGLVPRRIFHNSEFEHSQRLEQPTELHSLVTYPHPYKYHGHIAHSVNPTVPSKCAMRGETAGK